MFAVIFSVSLFILNIYCFRNKKYLYLFIPCMLFLPSYYGERINETLPIISVVRIMFIIFYIYTLLNKRRSLSDIKKINSKTLPVEFWFLGGYFLFRIASNLFYVFTYTQPLKTIFSLIFEQLLLLVAVYLLAPTKDELFKLTKAIVGTATVLFIIGYLESFSFCRPLDALFIASGDMMNEYSFRLGLLRATTTLYMPGIYANMCLYMLPLIFYLYEKTRSKKYLFITVLDILATIHSGCRANLFFVILIVLIYCLYVINEKNRRLLFFKNAAIVVGLLLTIILVSSFTSPKAKYFYTGTVKAVLNEVGFDFDLSKDAEGNSAGFGTNPHGTVSRLRQFTGLYYAAQVNPIFGLGSGAQTRGDIKYKWHKGWAAGNSYDVGIVEIFCDEGLLGLLGICSLYLYLIKKTNSSRLHQLIIITLLISTLNTGNIYRFYMMFVILFVNTNND